MWSGRTRIICTYVLFVASSAKPIDYPVKYREESRIPENMKYNGKGAGLFHCTALQTQWARRRQSRGNKGKKGN